MFLTIYFVSKHAQSAKKSLFYDAHNMLYSPVFVLFTFNCIALQGEVTSMNSNHYNQSMLCNLLYTH